MDLPLKQIPLILTSSKLITSPTDSGLFKKRRLSECSDSSNPSTFSDKSSLNEKFLELTLDNNSKLGSPDDQIKVEDTMPNIHTITIPKPVRYTQTRAEENPLEAPPKNENFLGSLIKMSQNDVQGISKYLNLDLNAKLQTWEKVTSNPSNPDQKEKFKLSSLFTSLLSTPLVNPFFKPEMFLSDSQLSGSTQSESDPLSNKFHYKEKYIGKLTQEQRKEKLEKYTEKKNNRKWKHIRYNIRKDLADKRERVQGRFVKTHKTFSHSDLMTKDKEKDNKMVIESENGVKNNSDLGSNFLSLSSSLGKRSAQSDLFEDSTTST